MTNKKKAKYADWQEYRGVNSNGTGRVPGQRVRASAEGIVIRAVPMDRVLGVSQARGQAAILNKAADLAESMGCPDALMEPDDPEQFYGLGIGELLEGKAPVDK